MNRKERNLFALTASVLLLAGCVNGAKQKGAPTPQDSVPTAMEAQPVDQSAGMQIIQALSKAYGDNPDIVGGFIGNSRCPSYLEGMYFDGGTLVLQVRGDTMQARQEIEQAAGSKAFRLEQVRDSLYSQKDLDLLMEQIRLKWDSVDPAVRANVQGYGTGLHTLDVNLVLNTPERRKAFREQVLDHPALRFSGTDGTELCRLTGTSDTLGVRIKPEFPSFHADARTVSFLLHNGGTDAVTYGEHYQIAYERDGKWYMLPINGNAVDLGHILRPGHDNRLTAHLHPLVNDNRPGRYRFFTEVTINSTKVTMMADFLLEEKP